MVQAIINISENTNRVLNIVKARYNLKDKSEAINKMAEDYEEVFEPEIRPEYAKELLRIDAEQSIPVKDIEQLKEIIGLGNQTESSEKTSKTRTKK